MRRGLHLLSRLASERPVCRDLLGARPRAVPRGGPRTDTLVPWAEDGRSMVERVVCRRDCAPVRRKTIWSSPPERIAEWRRMSALAALCSSDDAAGGHEPPGNGESGRSDDLRGKRVAMHCDGIRILEGMLDLHGIRRGDLELCRGQPMTWTICWSSASTQCRATRSAEPLELAERGLTVSTLTLRHPEAASLRASDLCAGFACSQLERSRRIERFLHVSFAGWRACLQDLDQASCLHTPRRCADGESGSGNRGAAPGEPRTCLRTGNGSDGTRTHRPLSGGLPTCAPIDGSELFRPAHRSVLRARHLVLAPRIP